MSARQRPDGDGDRGQAMTMRSYHMYMSVRGGIRMLREKRRNAKTYMTDDAGRPLSRDGAIDALMDELAKGREVIPLSACCGNPCPNADKGCAGFDYNKDGGCPGYPVAAKLDELNKDSP